MMGPFAYTKSSYHHKRCRKMKKMPHEMQITENPKRDGSYMWLLRQPYGPLPIPKYTRFGVKAVTTTELFGKVPAGMR